VRTGRVDFTNRVAVLSGPEGDCQLQQRIMLTGFVVAGTIVIADETGVIDVPWPLLIAALIIAFAVGYCELLSVILRCKATDVPKRLKELAGFKQFLVDAGLLALLALALLMAIFSYLRHSGVRVLMG
jgi:hypothetical protein